MLLNNACLSLITADSKKCCASLEFILLTHITSLSPQEYYVLGNVEISSFEIVLD